MSKRTSGIALSGSKEAHRRDGQAEEDIREGRFHRYGSISAFRNSMKKLIADRRGQQPRKASIVRTSASPLVTKADIVDHVVIRAGLSKPQAAAAVNAVIEAVNLHLAKGERVHVLGLGSAKRAARSGRNPRTGGTIEIPSSKKARFKLGKDLKEGRSKI